MLEAKDITNKFLFQGEVNQIQITNLEARVKKPQTIAQNKMVTFKPLLLSEVNVFRGGKLEKHVSLEKTDK